MKLTAYDMKIVWLILLLTITGFIINVYLSVETYNCIKNKNNVKQKSYIYFVLLIHHFVFSFYHFGWLFNNTTILFIYLLIPISILLHWSTNGWKCKLSQMINIVCDFNDSKLFEDLFDIIGLKKKYNLTYAIRQMYIVTVFCIGFYKLKKSNK